MTQRIFTAAEKLAEIRRELKHRESVCGKLVRDSKMTLEKADFEIAIMEQIAEDYEHEAERERLIR